MNLRLSKNNKLINGGQNIINTTSHRGPNKEYAKLQ